MWGMAGWTSRLCGKQSCWTEGITARMIPENADQALQSLCSSYEKKQGSDMLLRHSNANLRHKRTKNFQPKLPQRAIKERIRALRLGLCEESYVPKLTDSQKEELTISFGTDLRGCAAQQKPLSGCELVLETWVLSHCSFASSKPRGSMTNGNRNDNKIRTQTERVG